MSATERTAQETRDLILATAEVHLRRYGYSRTTVSEVARACKMSHANVYRFFKTKADMIDAVVEQSLNKTEIALQEIINQPISASERLEAYVLELYRSKLAQCSTDREMFEAISVILREHRTVVEQHIHRIRVILMEILKSGVQTKEFQITDLDLATTAVWDATLKFHHPLLVADTMDTPTELQARTVVKLLAIALTTNCI